MLHPFTVEVLDSEARRPDGSEEPVWTWDGNLESPTFQPSMLCYSTVHLCKDEHGPRLCMEPDCHEGHRIGYVVKGNVQWTLPAGAKSDDLEQVYGHNTDHTRDPAWGNCHSFLTAGVWNFLGDSAHAMAGRNVPMAPLPDYYKPFEDPDEDDEG